MLAAWMIDHHAVRAQLSINHPVQTQSRVADRQPARRLASLCSTHASRPPGAIMDPRSFEDLLRGDAYLPPRVTAVVPETVKFAVKELAEVDAWARRNKIKSRSEAIRLLVEKGLKA
jgi:hypothetical protein